MGVARSSSLLPRACRGHRGIFPKTYAKDVKLYAKGRCKYLLPFNPIWQLNCATKIARFFSHFR
jgi:hypothetical protein